MFKRGKRARRDIQSFERHLEDQIFQLQDDLISFRYVHGPYQNFQVFEPKKRAISKASVRDRLVHQGVHDILSAVFDKKFIFHSFSNRPGKGTHAGIISVRRMLLSASHNTSQPCFGLKMDIKQFFHTIDHNVLRGLIRREISDPPFLNLIDHILASYKTHTTAQGDAGIPLGNVTSQLFANIYLHELDLLVKHQFREKYYARFCDDFIFLSRDKSYLQSLIDPIKVFLKTRLHLELHPHKVTLRKFSQGIDFLGYVLFPQYQLVRNTTKKRMKRRLSAALGDLINGTLSPSSLDQRLQSYLGILSHANQHDLSQAIKNAYWGRGEKGLLSPRKTSPATLGSPREQ